MTSAKDIKRYEKLYELGCIACHKLGYFQQPTTVHHQLRGTHRIGNDATVPLCEFHHQSICSRFGTYRLARKKLGPSLSSEPRAFREAFGTDEELLELTNTLIGEL